MEQKKFNELALQLIEASKKQLLIEFKLLTAFLKEKVTDFKALMKLDINRLKWLQDWGEQLQDAEDDLNTGQTPNKQTFKTICNALQWVEEFEFENPLEYEKFKDQLRENLKK
jgi:hypothetical protein